MGNTMMKALEIGEKVAVIVAALVAIYGIKEGTQQLHELVAQTAVQNYTLRLTQESESATLMLKLSDDLESERFRGLRAALEDNDRHMPILKKEDGGTKGHFSGRQVEAYLDEFETIGLLRRRQLLLDEMTYDSFSFNAEKAWCNSDIRADVDAARKHADPTPPLFYEDFQSLAEDYLRRDNLTCDKLDMQSR